MAPGLEMFEIEEDHVLGAAEDLLGVEYVQLHQLEKRTGRGRAASA
ncbi:MAG: hypothetical protein ACOC8B_02915 [Gemmatimonadota bacterium]